MITGAPKHEKVAINLSPTKPWMDPNKTLRPRILGRPKDAPVLAARIPQNPDPPDTNRTPSTNFLYEKPLARSTNGAPAINEDGTMEDRQSKLHQTRYPGEDPPCAPPSASQESRAGGGGLCHSGLMTCSSPPPQLQLVYGSLVLR
jgi:hypothetical protein